MGIFAKKIKKYVASSVYSLAGDEDQTDPITLAIFGSTIRNSNTLGEDVASAVINSKRYSTDKYYKYFLNNNIQYLGIGDLVSEANTDADLIAQEMHNVLNLGANEYVRVYQAFTDYADIEYFAIQWLSNNYPNVSRDAYTADYDEAAQEIIVDFVNDGISMSARFAQPDDLTWALTPDVTLKEINGRRFASRTFRRLLYVTYSVLSQDENGAVVSVSNIETYIYRMRSGNTVFDNITTNEDNAYEFAPTLALKKYDQFYSEQSNPTKWAEMSTGYKRLTGGKLSDLVDKIKDNDSLDDVDFIYLFSGYDIGTKRPEGIEYLYRFFRKLMDKQGTSKEDYVTYRGQGGRSILASSLYDRYIKLKTERTSWLNDRRDPPSEQELELLNTLNDLFGSVPPAHPTSFPKPPRTNTLTIRNGFELHETTRMVMEFNYIDEKIKPGNFKREEDPAKVGEYGSRYVYLPEYYYTYKITSKSIRPLAVYDDFLDIDPIEAEYRFERIEGIAFYHQINEYYYKELIIANPIHRNYVYKAHAVEVVGKDAMNAEDDIGFLIPLHMPTVYEMSAKTKAKLNRTSSYLVFNAYERVVTRWYERGFFKIVLSVVLIVFVSWITLGAGLGAAAGLLGTNAAVGAAIGLSGMAAALAGAAINALAAIALTSAIGAVSTKVFGEKWGQVIAVIASFVIMNYSMGMQTASGGVDWGRMFSADNLLELTNTASRAYSAYLRGESLEIQAEMADARAEYEEDSEEIADLMAQLDNNNIMNQLGVFNWGLLDYGLAGNESRQSFLDRTTATATDIIRMQQAAITDFVPISLDLPGAIV